jgi:hypothetical protein
MWRVRWESFDVILVGGITVYGGAVEPRRARRGRVISGVFLYGVGGCFIGGSDIVGRGGFATFKIARNSVSMVVKSERW